MITKNEIKDIPLFQLYYRHYNIKLLQETKYTVFKSSCT